MRTHSLWNFVTNTAVTEGGGAYINGRGVVTGGRFEANAATGGSGTGGGLYIGNPLT